MTIDSPPDASDLIKAQFDQLGTEIDQLLLEIERPKSGY
jgi:hypothetical protein